MSEKRREKTELLSKKKILLLVSKQEDHFLKNIDQ